jgi:hypothetical protein
MLILRLVVGVVFLPLTVLRLVRILAGNWGWRSAVGRWAVGCCNRIWAGQAAVAGGPVAAWNRLAHSCSRCQPSGRCRVM